MNAPSSAPVNGGVAHLTVQLNVQFDVWFTYEGGPPPTSSTFTPIGTAIGGAAPAGATTVPTRPSVASGVLHDGKFCSIGSAIP